MKTLAKDRPPLLSRAILECCLAQPKRRDTLKGWVEWWLMENHIRWAVTEVKKALDYLVSRKLMRVRKARDGQEHYRVNAKKLGQIRRIVQQPSAREKADAKP